MDLRLSWRGTIVVTPVRAIDSPESQRLIYLGIHSFGDNPYNAPLALAGIEL